MTTKVLRLSPDLAVVPSMVQAVEVVPITRWLQMGTSDRDHPLGYSVMVTYLMAEKATPVASFEADHNEVVRSWDGGVVRSVFGPGYDASLVAAEARAHAVYEEIIRAVKDAA